MADTEREGGLASTRVAELKVRIEKATKLIGELRESNYSLSGEVAELRRELETASSGDARASSYDGDDGVAAELKVELDALREERATIRSKVVQLLERIEKLET